MSEQKRGELVVPRTVNDLSTTIRANDIRSWMQAAESLGHLLTPMTSAALPEGFGMKVTPVMVDVDNDTYDVEGKRGLSKYALNRIAGAMGISWIESRRVDDRSDPHYAEWSVKGVYKDPSGDPIYLMGTKSMDARDGSPFAKKTASKPRQLAETRLHICQHAETKAMLRAIRSSGIRTSYSREDLQKPFIAVKPVFTGETDDPELRRTFAVMRAAAALGSMSALYGADAALGVPTDPTAIAPERLKAPPPLAQSVDDDDDQPPARDGVRREEYIKAGPEKGVEIGSATTDGLAEYARTVQGWLDSPKLRDREGAIRHLKAVQEELAGRVFHDKDVLDVEFD